MKICDYYKSGKYFSFLAHPTNSSYINILFATNASLGVHSQESTSFSLVVFTFTCCMFGPSFILPSENLDYSK